MLDSNDKPIIVRDNAGRYAAHDVCEACRKPIRGEHYSDDETLRLGASGLTLCGRVRCCAKRDAMPVVERAAYYERAVAE